MKLLTINLEKKLIQEKTKEIAKLKKQSDVEAEILEATTNILATSVKEDIEALQRAGLTNAIKEVENVKNKLRSNERKTEELNDNPRIFTESEIKSIAIRYGLRFLPSDMYKGNLPNDLGQKIKDCENIYGRKSSNSYYVSPYYILAPKESFQLQSKPKDPLMFLSIGNDKYYLIHKWGNDLSITRWFSNLFVRNEDSFFVMLSLSITIAIFSLIELFSNQGIIFRHFAMNECQDKAWNEVSCDGHYLLLWIVPLVSLFISFLATGVKSDNETFNRYTWKSKFKD